MEHYLEEKINQIINYNSISINDLKQIIYIYCHSLNDKEKELVYFILNRINQKTTIKNDVLPAEDFYKFFANDYSFRSLN